MEGREKKGDGGGKSLQVSVCTSTAANEMEICRYRPQTALHGFDWPWRICSTPLYLVAFCPSAARGLELCLLDTSDVDGGRESAGGGLQ